MTERRTPPGFAARPADPERWVRAPDKPSTINRFTARLTIDVTPALRGSRSRRSSAASRSPTCCARCWPASSPILLEMCR
jgi:hypothetical protein